MEANHRVTAWNNPRLVRRQCLFSLVVVAFSTVGFIVLDEKNNHKTPASNGVAAFRALTLFAFISFCVLGYRSCHLPTPNTNPPPPNSP